MNRLLPKTAIPFLIIFSFLFAHHSQAQTGDAATACEVILCLSTGSPPSQCSDSLKKFFSIQFRRPDKTLKARGNFLKLCPASDDSSEMSQLVDAIAQGGGACEAADLNRILLRMGEVETYIVSNMPSFCKVYYNHEFTALGELPKYVGTPYDGGRWVEASAYPAAKAAYDARIKAERKAQQDADYYP